jgi:hypothetical protein
MFISDFLSTLNNILELTVAFLGPALARAARSRRPAPGHGPGFGPPRLRAIIDQYRKE